MHRLFRFQRILAVFVAFLLAPSVYAASTPWKEVSVGMYEIFALKSDGRLYVAGSNSRSVFGVNTPSSSSNFIKVLTNVKSIKACGLTSFALSNDGTLYATGYNNTGLLGLGVTTQTIATWTPTLTNVTSIECSGTSSIAVTGDGAIYAAGANRYGMLGLGDEIDRTAWEQITPPGDPFKIIIPGYFISIAIDNGNATFWSGYNGYHYKSGYNGPPGYPSTSTTFIATPVNFTDSIKQVVNISGSSYFLLNDGRMYVIGLNNDGNLGTGSIDDLTALTLSSLNGIKQIAAVGSSEHTTAYALTNSRTVYAAGYNANGETGTGNNGYVYNWTPTISGVDKLFNNQSGGVFAGISGFSAAVIKNDGALWVTGRNDKGQLGIGNVTNQYTWVQSGLIAPDKVTATATQGTVYGKVSVSWTADPEADTYDIYRSTASGTKGSLIVQGLTSTTLDDTNITVNTHYFYTVVAKNSVGASPDSVQAEGWGSLPPAPNDLSATQGTATNKIILSWTNNANATAYEIWRSTTQSGSATKIATITPSSSYNDTTVNGVASYFYTVRMVVGSLTSTNSNQVEGWANAAPTQATVTISTDATSPSIQTPVTITDPNVTAGKTETFTLAITEQPANGAISIFGTKLVYTPPSDGMFSGQTTFGFTVTDKGGAVFAATGTVNVVCSSPTISSFTLPLTSVTQASSFQSNATYSLPVCSTNGQLKVDVLDSNSVVVVSGTPVPTPNGVSQTHTFTSAGILTAGTYAVRLSAISDSGTATKTAALTVKAVNLPALIISPGLNVTVGEETVTATLTNPIVVNCPFTQDPATATADPTQCYISLTAPPPSGMSVDTSGELPSMTGIIDTEGGYPITAEVFKHDGVALQKIGQVSKTVTANCGAPTISSVNIPDLLPYEAPNYAATYKAFSCNGALTGSLTIKKNTNTLETIPLNGLDWGTAATLTKTGTGLAAGNYTAELSLQGSYGTAYKIQPFQVKTVPMPTLNVSPTNVPQGEIRVDVSLTPSTDTICPLTTVQAEAEADPKKCFVALSTTLSDMENSLDSNNLPVLAGYPATVGDYTVQALVSRWVNGTRYDYATLTKTVKVTPVIPPVFSFTGKSNLYVGIEKASLIFKQDSGTTCTLFADASTAQTEAGKGKRACFVNFTGDSGLNKTLSLSQYKLEGALTSVGTQTIGYSVRRQFADGLSTELQTGSLDVTVNDLPPPQVTLKGGYKITDGKYYVPINQAITRAMITAGVPTNAKMKYQVIDSQQNFERGGVMSGGSYWILTKNLELLEERPVTLRVSWQDYPQVYSEQVITAVGGTESNMKLVIETPQKTADTELVTVKVKVGKYTKAGINYTPDTMGQWRTQIVAQTNTMTIKTPITEMQDMVNGEATFQVNPVGVLFIKITAVAELISNVEGLDTTLSSSTRYVQVVKGSPIEGVITAKTLDGPAPKTFTLNLNLTLDNRVALKEVTWEQSSDDGVTWETQEKSNTIRHNIAIVNPGKIKARAKMINKNTLAASYTDPVEVWAYSTLDANIVGPRHVAPGYPITLAAQLYREGVVTTDTVNEWTIEAPSGKTKQTGATVTVTEEIEGKIYLTLRSRLSDTRADDPNAWSAARSYVVVATPTRPSIYAKGPRDVETGKVYTYTGTVQPSWGSMESVHSTASEWQLPDGSTVSGQTLDWSPTTQDLTDKIPLIFRSWVNGFKETTTSETKITYVPWEYVWPTWTLSMKQLTVQAPSDLILLVKHDRPDMNRRFEGLTYEWSFPNDVTGWQNTAFPNRAGAQVLYEGEYDISVTIRDSRGHQTLLTQHVVAEAAIPYSVTLKVAKSNYHDRAPMTITVRPTIYGGHPLDSVIGKGWFVDGVPVDDFANRSFMVKELTDAGNHTIRYTLNSKMGETATVDSPLFLVANQLPICELTAKPNAYVVYAEAKCTDPDGKVIGYSWQVNGQPIGSTSYRISFSKTGTPQSANVTITAMDDAKELSIPVSINVDF